MWRTSWTLLHRGLQMHNARQRTRAPVTLLPRYKGVAKERRGGWVGGRDCLHCKHVLHRTTLHRFCNMPGRVDYFNRAKALGPPWLPRGLPRHRTPVTVV